MNEFLSTSIKFLKGVGEVRAEVLGKELGIFTVHDMLLHFPFRYVDRSQFYKISDVDHQSSYIQIKGQIPIRKMI